MRRISLQRLECGYTPGRPFRTLSRAIVAGIITSRDYLDLTLILRRPCQHCCCSWRTCHNGPGGVQEWEDGKEPTDDELTAFNPAKGGIIMPRGCSVISLTCASQSSDRITCPHRRQKPKLRTAKLSLP